MSKEMNSQYYLQPKIITNNMDFKKNRYGRNKKSTVTNSVTVIGTHLQKFHEKKFKSVYKTCCFVRG